MVLKFGAYSVQYVTTAWRLMDELLELRYHQSGLRFEIMRFASLFRDVSLFLTG